MRANRHCVLTRSLPDVCAKGQFVTPTLIEIPSPADLRQEVFGPVLHVVRYAARDLDGVLDAITASGYGLTLGIQSRVDETIARIVSRVPVGNVYVNRNMIGAVVGVQPFGGEGLSGTGPKAGGPLTLYRLVRGAPAPLADRPRPPRPALDQLDAWLADGAAALVDEAARGRLRAHLAAYRRASLAGLVVSLDGPTGETNTLIFAPRGAVLGLAGSAEAWLHQLAAALATGNRLLLPDGANAEAWRPLVPSGVQEWVERCLDAPASPCAAVLVDFSDMELFARWRVVFAERAGPILPFLAPSPAYSIERLIVERCVTVNTAATGGNAGLMRLGDA
jgi:RHH-type proline utilization regulon transcriptional repressor/proline dehydrogenase/delta 1-pyrroline-5-carboxylate dehydrogenase